MKKNTSLTLAVLSSTLLIAACASSKPPTFGETLQAEGKSTANIGKKWEEGQSLVQKGEKRIAKGRKQISAGNDNLEKGESMIQKGRRLIREAESEALNLKTGTTSPAQTPGL